MVHYARTLRSPPTQLLHNSCSHKNMTTVDQDVGSCLISINNWDDIDCAAAVNAQIFSEDSAYSNLESAFDTFLGQVDLLGNEDKLVDFCNRTGVCGQFLESFCTGQSLGGDYDRFCGCYYPSSDIYVTSDCFDGGANCGLCDQDSHGGNCTITTACNPSCLLGGAISKFQKTSAGVFAQNCPRNICIINDVSINAVSSKVSGGVNFNQICSGCSDSIASTGSECLCIIQSSDVTSTMSQIGVGSNFNQLCSSSSVCMTENGSPGSCDVKVVVDNSLTISWLFIAVLIFIGLVVVSLIFAFR